MHKSKKEQEEERQEEEQRQMMEFRPEALEPAFNLGPLVYQSNTLTYQMFGFKGPLWMTQTCNDGSGCPFAQGSAGGASYDQTNAWLWRSFGKPGETLEAFTGRCPSNPPWLVMFRTILTDCS